MTRPRFGAATLSVLVVGGAATGCLMLAAAGGPRQVSPVLLGFFLWAALPYVVLGLAVRIAGLGGFLGALAAVAFGLAIYTNAMFINPDAQSGLAFVFVPAYQLAAVLMLLGGIAAWRIRVSRTANLR